MTDSKGPFAAWSNLPSYTAPRGISAYAHNVTAFATLPVVILDYSD